MNTPSSEQVQTAARPATPTNELPIVDQDAWSREPGPILLLAGPGTGKTHQLALRIKHLVVARQIPPDTISVITFTKEAAENMRRRIADEEKKDVFIEPDKRPSQILTMHSLGLQIVRTNAEALGLPADFQVVTNLKLRRILFRDAAILAGYSESEASAADRSRQEGTEIVSGSSVALITEGYERLLRINGAIDYDDQINLACHILASNEDVCKQYAARTHHLLVDEYQDINPGQRRLIDLLSRDHPEGLFVVGDDDQSIYSFRGGTPEYIRNFAAEFGPHATLLSLVASRRCPDTVVNGALNVVEAFDPGRRSKPAPTFAADKQGAPPIKVHSVASDDQEADIIARMASGALPRKSVLVLIPAKQYADRVKHALRSRRINYDHPPGLDDSGLVLLEMVYDWTQHPERSFPLRLCIDALCEGGTAGIPSRRSKKPEKVEARNAALAEVAGLWNDVASAKVSLWQALQGRAAGDTVLTALHQKLEALRNVEASHVGEFLAILASDMKPWGTLSELVQEVKAWLEELRGHQQASEGGVRIMTLQAAKGLEADVVFVVGLNDGILPRNGATDEQVQESARLTYVSMTRAKGELHLFHARTRDASVTYLSESFQLKPSRFLEVVADAHKEAVYHPAPSKTRASGTKARKK